jgi:hypothetical protein
VAAGIGVRLHDRRNHSERSDTVIKARSPFGYVLADPGTVFDFYVGENSAEVVAVRGKVSPVHAATSQVRRLGWIPVSPSGPESGYI